MQEHLKNILNSLVEVSKDNEIKKDRKDIFTLRSILFAFLSKLSHGMDLHNPKDMESYKTAEDIIFNLNANNNHADITEYISNEYYAFGFLLEGKEEPKDEEEAKEEKED